ncbi:biopolymer transporter ExbD [Chitinispirillales bacterium ANBcel5]|uniref:biopolymer transporter ExbD n=1 Tax=Cellulosispirillum alkaliphilum TaxID=3039283 RepID=UPI002A558BA0|nr:biopolymer transporter ExbD [Chitinispirillales bacterium ANBcel5]
MSFLSSCKTFTHPSEAADVADVDVTPVMNMFIILIPFLVSMAVFTQLSIHSFSVPPNVSEALQQTDEKPKLRLTVVLAEQYLALTVGDTMLDSIGVQPDKSHFQVLRESLLTNRSGLDIKDEVVVAVRDAIRFQAIVKTMDLCREAGFSQIGVSSATENPLEGI